MNNVSLVGRITKEPELRYTPNGSPVITFTIAVDRPFAKDTTDFIACVAWNQQAEFIGNYIKKGNLIGLTGTIQTRSYQAKNGETRVITEVVLDTVKNYTPKDNNQIKTTPNPNSSVLVNGQGVDDDLPF